MKFPEIEVVATTVPCAFVVRMVFGRLVTARLVVVAFVEVELVVMMLVELRFVMVATAAVRESAIAVVKRASDAKNVVDVAFVAVALVALKLWTVEEPNAMRPPEKVMSEVVALFGNGSCTVVPELSVPQTRTPAAVALTSQLAALRFDTTSAEVDAVPEMARFVVVAFVVVVFWKTLPPVKVLFVYVFGIVLDELMYEFTRSFV